MKHRLILTVLSIALLVLLLCGCNTVSVNDPNSGVAFRATMMAWPWQDSSRIMERMNLSSKGSNFTASIRGLTESEVTSTNFQNLVEAVMAGAVRGAISAMPK